MSNFYLSLALIFLCCLSCGNRLCVAPQLVDFTINDSHVDSRNVDYLGMPDPKQEGHMYLSYSGDRVKVALEPKCDCLASEGSWYKDDRLLEIGAKSILFVAEQPGSFSIKFCVDNHCVEKFLSVEPAPKGKSRPLFVSRNSQQITTDNYLPDGAVWSNRGDGSYYYPDGRPMEDSEGGLGISVIEVDDSATVVMVETKAVTPKATDLSVFRCTALGQVAGLTSDQRCTAEEISWVRSGEVKIKPDATSKLEQVTVFANAEGRIAFVLKAGDETSETVLANLNRGFSQINLEELYLTMLAGRTYTLTYEVINRGTREAAIEDISSCFSSLENDPLITYNDGKYSLFDLKICR